MIRRWLHRLRTFACIDGDPQPRTCGSSWCWLDHSDNGYCDEPLVTATALYVCTLTDGHTGHHHDEDADVRWSRNFGAAA